jgi:hypothetical protein
MLIDRICLWEMETELLADTTTIHLKQKLLVWTLFVNLDHTLETLERFKFKKILIPDYYTEILN